MRGRDQYDLYSQSGAGLGGGGAGMRETEPPLIASRVVVIFDIIILRQYNSIRHRNVNRVESAYD